MFSLKRLLLLALLLLACATSFAQTAFRHFKVTHWDSRTGLPNDISLNLYQSREGFIWLSGYSGLIRFDGAEFIVYNSRNDSSFKSDGITSIIYQTPDSALWIPTPGSGLIRLKHGKTTRHLTNMRGQSLYGITRSGDLIIGTGPNSLNYTLFNYKTLASKVIDTRRTDSVQKNWTDPQEVNWLNPLAAMRIMRKGPFTLDGKIIAPDIDTTALNNSLLLDSKNRTWVGSDLGVFQLINGKSVVPKGLEGQVIIPAGFSRSMILEDNNGGIWVGTRNGVAYMAASSDHFTFYTGTGNLKSNNVQGLLKDAEGNIWVASDKGVFKFSASRVINISDQDGITNSRMNSVTEVDNGKFLFVTRDNLLYNFDGEKVRPVSADTQRLIQSPKEIYYLYIDKRKNLWATANGPLYRIGKDGNKTWDLNTQLRYVTEGIDGKIYVVASGQGLIRLNDQDGFDKVPMKGLDAQNPFLSTAKQRANGDWILTSYNTGIYIGKENETLRHYPTINGVGGVQVFSSYEDKQGHLWFGTAKGLAVLRAGVDTLDVIDTEDGMPHSSSFEVLEDEAGYFWLPTNVGVMKASRNEILAHITNRQAPIQWSILDESDGILNQQFVGARHSIIASDKRMYFPNLSGLVIIDPKDIQTNTNKPKLAINGLSVDGKFFPAEEGLRIPPGDHRLIISYSALSFLAPEKTQIKFRLVGYDQDWITSRGDRRAIYTNLPPGEHVFEMIAANNDGVWADAPVQFKFTIEPKFYQTTWFKLLGVLALLGLIWLIVRWKTSATRQRNQELEKEVNKRTEQISRQKHELENMVTTLQSTQKQLIQQEKMASLGELTAGIAHEIQNPLNFINNFSELNKELIDELKAEADPVEKDQILGDIVSNLDKVLFHGKRADSIVKSMLQHSHSKTGEKERTDINALADEYLRLSFHGLRAKDKNFQSDFSIDADPAVGQINIVRQDISRVLLNIINNAFYAVHDKAQKSGDGYKPLVTVRTKKEAGKVVITIQDNGDGIPENIIHKIFQPFFTTKPTGQGTGLGLSMSYDIVKSQGGDIQVSSEEGKGTTFTIQLPA